MNGNCAQACACGPEIGRQVLGWTFLHHNFVSTFCALGTYSNRNGLDFYEIRVAKSNFNFRLNALEEILMAKMRQFGQVLFGK